MYEHHTTCWQCVPKVVLLLSGRQSNITNLIDSHKTDFTQVNILCYYLFY